MVDVGGRNEQTRHTYTNVRVGLDDHDDGDEDDVRTDMTTLTLTLNGMMSGPLNDNPNDKLIGRILMGGVGGCCCGWLISC